MWFFDWKKFVLLNAWDHWKMNKCKNIHSCFVDDCNVTCAQEDNEMLKVDQEAVVNKLRHLLLLRVDFLRIYFLNFSWTFESCGPTTASAFSITLLFDFRSHMQNFIDNFQQMIATPLLVVFHDIFKDTIHLVNNIHLHQISKFNLTRMNNCSDYFNCERIEFCMIHFKVLEQDFNQLQLV